jgi:hypothetical protein
MKVIIKLIFHICFVISAVAVLIGLIYLVVNGLDVFLQYRLFILSKPLTYVVISGMVLCVLVNYLNAKKEEKSASSYTLAVHRPFTYVF